MAVDFLIRSKAFGALGVPHEPAACYSQLLAQCREVDNFSSGGIFEDRNMFRRFISRLGINTKPREPTTLDFLDITPPAVGRVVAVTMDGPVLRALTHRTTGLFRTHTDSIVFERVEASWNEAFVVEGRRLEVFRVLGDELHAVSAGEFMTLNGRRIETHEMPVRRCLEVCARSPQDVVFACGRDGVWHFDGCTSRQVVTHRNFSSVAMAECGEVWAVGTWETHSCMAVRRAGTWNCEVGCEDFGLGRVCVTPSGQMVALGHDAWRLETVPSFGESPWQKMPTPDGSRWGCDIIEVQGNVWFLTCWIDGLFRLSSANGTAWKVARHLQHPVLDHLLRDGGQVRLSSEPRVLVITGGRLWESSVLIDGPGTGSE